MENFYGTINAPLKTKAEFVSTEDFRVYTGIDLSEELNDSRDAELFLRDREDELINYANMQSWRPITRYVYEHYYSPEQMTALREAILLQAKYVFENGDVLANNGIDPENGVKFGKYERESASISPKAINLLKVNGILSLVMRTTF